MQRKFKSEGKCLFCEKTFAKAGINRHLTTHLNEKTKTGKAGKSFLVKIETNKRWGATPYFLSLWVDGDTTMKTIDKFLRDIWLECCGHMSAFRNIEKKGNASWDLLKAMELMAKGKVEEYEKMMEKENGEVPMSRKAKEVLTNGLTLEYEYDFGSSTELELTVVSEYPIKADGKIVLLSRNEPLEITCETCGKEPATQICAVCIHETESVFCDKCAKKHSKTCNTK